MAESTRIAWCDATFNPWIGCTKVSPGCDHCYAKASFDDRKHRAKWGPGQPRSRTKTWDGPVKWNDRTFVQCDVCGWRGDLEAAGNSGACPSCSSVDKYTPARRRVFCASLADVGDNEVPIEWFADFLDLCRLTPNLDKLLLTKRIGNVMKRLEGVAAHLAIHWPVDHPLQMWVAQWRDGNPPADIWLGATIVNQEEADRDIPKLLATPARVRFLSMEPLLGPVDLRHVGTGLGGCLKRQANYEASGAITRTPRIDWVIVGGESGPKARPMHPDWARSLRDQCKAAGVPFLFKQWGEWHPQSSANYATAPNTYRYGKVEGLSMMPSGAICLHNAADAPAGRATIVDAEAMQGWHDRCRRAEGKPDAENYPFGYQWLHRVGKKAAGRLLDGTTHDAFPEVSV
jgi:protein gp37